MANAKNQTGPEERQFEIFEVVSRRDDRIRIDQGESTMKLVDEAVLASVRYDYSDLYRYGYRTELILSTRTSTHTYLSSYFWKCRFPCWSGQFWDHIRFISAHKTQSFPRQHRPSGVRPASAASGNGWTSAGMQRKPFPQGRAC